MCFGYSSEGRMLSRSLSYYGRDRAGTGTQIRLNKVHVLNYSGLLIIKIYMLISSNTFEKYRKSSRKK